ncbi:MAG TPA: GTPase Era [Gemmatimonadota bacterium]|nr:GTPase Era [Gemmatimonadota bacterium]
MSEAGEARSGQAVGAEVATRAGFVALVGRPNAGKSTLLNALVGEHLAAVSRKAQTTRHRIPGFLTDDSTQFVFVDTPGFLDPAYALQQSMLDTALSALDGVDVVCWLVDHDQPSEREEALLRELAGRRREGKGASGSTAGDTLPLFLVLTKSDQVPATKLDDRERTWRELPVWSDRYRLSAVTGAGLPELLAGIRARLPEQPFFYDPEDLTDLNLRFLAAEMVREACYEELGAELPYSVHVEVTEWREPAREEDKTLIRATIYVERESQKGIVIGSGGGKLGEIGRRSRASIEAMIGAPVFLELLVKVRPKWSRRERDLQHFGYRR